MSCALTASAGTAVLDCGLATARSDGDGVGETGSGTDGVMAACCEGSGVVTAWLSAPMRTAAPSEMGAGETGAAGFVTRADLTGAGVAAGAGVIAGSATGAVSAGMVSAAGAIIGAG